MSEPNPYHEYVDIDSDVVGVLITIENTYEDEHECSAPFIVPAPTGDLDDWWEDVVQPLTGCGHGAPEFDAAGNCTVRTLDAVYEATVENVHPDVPNGAALIGETREWGL